ncbi:MAG TPA: GNAT family N-acetyltransferase [Acholeplasmataceae bacterium]|jgi:aminoglycoside 6'-N-acetyltransferase I|nr:GNAT family N-acetyltransferase [Acholeplasmataceae bacterium]
MNINIERIDRNSVYFQRLVELGIKLWPDNSYNDLYDEFKNSNHIFFGATFNNYLIGFIQISIRTDYVNGSTTSPVGFIEGIFVDENYRKKGIARKLVDRAVSYFKNEGIKEIASDVLIDNIDSQNFHKSIGFEEIERVVCYIKRI